MNIDFYKTFLTVVQTMSFTKTASLSNLSQSTVSNRIQALEQFYGHPLFNRENNKIVTTSYGKALISYAEHLIRIETDASDHLDKITNLKNTIHIGAVHAYYKPYLKTFINGFLSENSELLKVDLRHSKDVIQGVIAGKYDLGISHHASHFNLYQCDLLYQDELILVATQNYKQYREGLTIETLKELKIFHSNLFDEHIESDLFNMLPYKFSIDVSDKMIDLLIDHQACSFLPRMMVQDLLGDQLMEIPLLDYSLPLLPFYLIYRKDSPYKTILKKNPKGF